MAGQLLDIRRQLAFRDDVEVTILILYDEEGAELIRLDHFWHVLPPRVRFGDSYESVQFLVTEDEVALDVFMAATKSLRYEVKQPISPGGVLVASLVLGGIDYSSGDVGTIDGGVGGTYEVLTVLGGAVVTFKIVDRGSGYTAGETTTQATSGLGIGLSTNLIEVGLLLVSESHKPKSIPQPPAGRNRTWDIRTTTQAFVNEFFRPPGE